jgi:hypothetical protein
MNDFEEIIFLLHINYEMYGLYSCLKHMILMHWKNH